MKTVINAHNSAFEKIEKLNYIDKKISNIKEFDLIDNSDLEKFRVNILKLLNGDISQLKIGGKIKSYKELYLQELIDSSIYGSPAYETKERKKDLIIGENIFNIVNKVEGIF